MLASLRADPGIVLSGRDAAAEAGAPVDPGGEIDAYVRRSGADALVRGVRAREVLENANLLLHVVDDDVWPFERGQRYAAPWVAWLDLEDRQDRAAGTLLDRLLGGRIRA
ncbi:MAG TPA: hypothetical protein VMN58_09255 [Acidimicrobiales bacterium]|nr:hypothetical protein [Acidimicrobiales bacterium]